MLSTQIVAQSSLSRIDVFESPLLLLVMDLLPTSPLHQLYSFGYNVLSGHIGTRMTPLPNSLRFQCRDEAIGYQISVGWKNFKYGKLCNLPGVHVSCFMSRSIPDTIRDPTVDPRSLRRVNFQGDSRKMVLKGDCSAERIRVTSLQYIKYRAMSAYWVTWKIRRYSKTLSSSGRKSLRAWREFAHLCYLLLPTSASVERAFSMLKYIYTDQQSVSMADLIKTILMLRYNKD